ncbi:MAG: cache domain-containing protein [Geobacteraceae bacterium]|nr:cache domain-containing protein [Geobacteraceae bacterium]
MKQSRTPSAINQTCPAFLASTRLSAFLQYSLMALLFLFSLFLTSPTLAADRLSPYLYEDTKQLVRLVEDAATLMERNGTAAFAEFDRKDSRWFNQAYYFFVYDLTGVNVFHAASPELTGKNLMDFRDMNGKPVLRFVTDIGKKPQRDASGWVFYRWQEKNDFLPKWKSAYIRKVVALDNRIYLLGCGVYNFKLERVIIQENIRQAAELLASQGKETAFQAFRDPSSSFNFLDTYVYVMDEKGRALVDPAFPKMQGRDLSNFKDAIGRPVMKEIIAKLQTHDEAWVQYLWPKPGAARLSRKLAYVRKVRVDGETLFVGSDFFLATPIWMSH